MFKKLRSKTRLKKYNDFQFVLYFSFSLSSILTIFLGDVFHNICGSIIINVVLGGGGKRLTKIFWHHFIFLQKFLIFLVVWSNQQFP